MSKHRRNPDSPIREGETELTDRVSQRLRGALLVLSPQERAILALHNGFAYSHAEVAEILGLDESEVARVVEELRPRLRGMGSLAGNDSDAEDDSIPPA